MRKRDPFVLMRRGGSGESGSDLEANFIAVLDGTAVTPKLPDELTALRDYAFGCCTNLALTSLPENLTSIGQYGFDYCRGLIELTFKENLTSISAYAFRGCIGLTELTFKGTPTTIAGSAFTYCTNLTTINVPWAEGAVANAPWGATNATINYNYTGE